MAIDVTLKTINSGYNTTTINENFQALKSALLDGVSRSGFTPNTMTADFDMNSNDILNANVINTVALNINGSTVVPTELVSSSFLALAGSNSPTANINWGGYKITNLGTSDQDGLTKVGVESASYPATVVFIRTTGFTTAGDGGHAVYKYSASEPSHAGKIQSADSKWWELVVVDRVSLKVFGAVIDNSTDDFDAVQDAVSSGFRLWHPGGTSLVSAQVELPASGLDLAGAGRDVAKIATTTTANESVLHRTTATTGGNVYVDGVYLEGNGVNKTGGSIIDVAQLDSITITNSYLHDAFEHCVLTRDDGSPPTTFGADNAFLFNTIFDTNQINTGADPHIVYFDSIGYGKVLFCEFNNAKRGSGLQFYTSGKVEVSFCKASTTSTANIFAGFRFASNNPVPDPDGLGEVTFTNLETVGYAIGLMVLDNNKSCQINNIKIHSPLTTGMLLNIANGSVNNVIIRDPDTSASGTAYGVAIQSSDSGVTTGINNTLMNVVIKGGSGLVAAFHESLSANTNHYLFCRHDAPKMFGTLSATSSVQLAGPTITFTPTFDFSTTSSTGQSYTTQIGRATPSGDGYDIFIHLVFNTGTALGTGNAQVKFDAAGITAANATYAGNSIPLAIWENINISGTHTTLIAEAVQNQAYLQLRANGDNTTDAAMTASNFTTSTTVEIKLFGRITAKLT